MSFRNSSIHQAINSGDTDAVSALLADGADVNATNDAGQTPLILAVVGGRYQLLRLLLGAGANPLLRDNTGLSAIDWAERKGETELAQLLAKHSQSGGSSPDAARVQEDERKTTIPPEEDASRVPLSSEERTRRFVAGLKQRLDEKAGQDQSNFPIATDERERRPKQNEEVLQKLFERVEPGPATSERPVEDFPVIPKKSTADLISEKLTADQEQQRAREQLIRERYRKAVTTPEKVAPQVTTKVDVAAPTQEVTAFSAPSPKSTRSSSKLKRCPQCGTVYNSELLAYCSYDAVALVDADEPIVTSEPPTSPLLWLLVVAVLVLGVVAGLYVTSRILEMRNSDTQTVAAPQPPPSQKGIAVVGQSLVGKDDSLPAAEVPANTVEQPTSVTVRVRIDRAGRVTSADSEDGDEVLRAAAIAAAKKAAFSVEKLRGRSAEGTITYTFK